MKVSELITKLSTYNPDTNVKIEYVDQESYGHESETLTVVPDSKDKMLIWIVAEV